MVLTCRNYILVSLMPQSLLPFLYAELTYSIVFNVLFGVFFLRKVIKLDKLGENHDVSIPRKVWLQFAIILAIISLLALHLILSFTTGTYWLNSSPNFSLVMFLYVGNYAMQSYIVLKLLSKGNGKRYIPNFFFWLFCMAVSIIEVVVVQMLEVDPNFTVFIPLLVAILNFSLLFISLIFDKNTSKSFLVRQLNQKNSVDRTIQDSICQWERVTPSNRLFIQFNQNFQIDQFDKSLTCLFKIAVYVDENATIISKTDSDFYKLNIEMEKFFPHRSEVVLPEQNRKFSNMMKLGQEKLKIYETYLLDLTRTGEFIVPCLLDFLEVPASLRSKLMIHERRESFIRKESGVFEVEDKMRKPFFTVTCQEGKYVLENTDFLELIVNKSIPQILQFYNKLKEEKRVTIDILPEQPKPEDIVGFLGFVVNRKSLWRSFSSWFRLDIQLENKVYNYFDPWITGFKKVELDIVGHEIVFDGDGKIHTCYLLSVKNKQEKRVSISNHFQDRGLILKKRYSEFCTLDKHIRRFMNKQKMNFDNLPALPPKFSPFGSKTSPKSRQVRFGIYMKGVIQIEGINHCVKLLEFLDFDSMKEVESPLEIEPQPVETSELSYFSDLNEKQ